ncbi:hypothetical protein EVAR_57871_1 [Eumeta japonica]|uniref:Uncharacterized protein n=1 Tax=Eumeta variegata TaxID=151549 RepID=A0A4C1ZHS5_EUMVA|nr:hypothetical protein EVAR_57871_1 [Eumeta japonica]
MSLWKSRLEITSVTLLKNGVYVLSPVDAIVGASARAAGPGIALRAGCGLGRRRWRRSSSSFTTEINTVILVILNDILESMHIENGQRVYYTASNAAQRAATPPATTLTSFFEICQSDPFAKTLFYSEMPRYYTWNASTKKIQRRKQGDAVLGHQGECLRANIFESLRTVNSIVYPTFRAAYQELNLLENDNHWDTTLAEASISASPSQIRTLFSIIISTCFPSKPSDLWNKYKDNMSEDILHQIRISSRSSDFEASEEVHNQALLLIEDMCYVMCVSLLVRLEIPAPHR